jgi:hypothetical protein
MDMRVLRSAERRRGMLSDWLSPSRIGGVRVEEVGCPLNFAGGAPGAIVYIVEHDFEMLLRRFRQTLPRANIVDRRKLLLLINHTLDCFWKFRGGINCAIEDRINYRAESAGQFVVAKLRPKVTYLTFTYPR